ncbi:MAG TPA: transglycosylase SLT domain-containing protein, partial [Mammaliicoccus lentus]
KQALGLAGLPQTSAYINAWLRQINTESTGNPKAVGPGSSEGNPKGLVQVKPGTFNAYKLGGHGNIFNGLDNLIAGMRYAKARYGKGGMLSRIGVGGPYANGGLVTKHQVAEIGEGNKPEMVIPLTRKARAMQLIEQAKSFMGVDDEGSISSAQNTSNDSAMVQVMEQNNKLLEMLIGVVQNKELIVDKQAIVDTANNGLGKRYKEQSYTRGGI